jgi:hypothetical protein
VCLCAQIGAKNQAPPRPLLQRGTLLLAPRPGGSCSRRETSSARASPIRWALSCDGWMDGWKAEPTQKSNRQTQRQWTKTITTRLLGDFVKKNKHKNMTPKKEVPRPILSTTRAPHPVNRLRLRSRLSREVRFPNASGI